MGVRTTIDLSHNDYDFIQKYANKRGLSFSEGFEMILHEYHNLREEEEDESEKYDMSEEADDDYLDDICKKYKDNSL